jgi:serine/threonine-protein kinase
MNGPSTSPADDMVGRTLLGRYRVVRRLAEGGMGVVYLARAEGAAGFIKPVVIKLILSSFAASPEFLGMFVREAQILAQLRHPGIVDVVEFGEQDGAYVMVLEYVSGYHLGQWAGYVRVKGRKVPTEIAVQIVIGVLDALHHVHTLARPDGTPLRITHRDVSPSNILLSIEGYAKLVDFGVARMEAETLFRTQGSGFRGKLAYGAPELFEGAEGTARGDVYSCAVVLHELLIGRNVFAGRSQADTMARVMNHAAESVHGVRDDAPDDIDAILARGLAKAPADRYASAAEFAQALRQTQRSSEQRLREQLAALLRVDFGDEIAELLGMETLARRDRAWRSFSMAPPPMPPLIAPPPAGVLFDGLDSIHDQPTRVLDGPPAARTDDAPPVADAPSPAVASEIVSEGARVAPEPARGGGWSRWALGALAIAVVVGGWWLSQRERERPARPQRIVLVESERGRGARDDMDAVAPTAAPTALPAATPVPASTPTTAPTPAATVLTEGVAETGTSADGATKTARGAAAKREGPDPAALTRAFRRRQNSVEACFAQHAGDLPGGRQVEIHFEVDARGRAQRAALVPEALESTALGACLRKVALATRFPSQGETVAFRIPVTAHRVSVGD